MEGRGGCCIAKLSGGHVAGYDSSNINQIMMRFRPIAPKPPPPNSAAPSSSDGGGSHAKPASRCNRARKKCTPRRKRKSCSPDRTAQITPPHHHHHDHNHSPVVKAAVTLPLLPEAPDLSPSQPPLVVHDNYIQSHRHVTPDRTALVPPRHEKIVSSYVIVEGITDTWTADDDHQYSMMMKSIRLEDDTCPGLITDAWHRVWWTNEAYRRMVMMEEDTCRDQKMGVWVMMKEKLPDALQGFTCRVRVQRSYHGDETTGSSSSSSSSTSTMRVPCDVWRINGGGWFAWRLDVDAALSLGR